MLMLISQDERKAINIDKIEFFYIPPDKNHRGKYSLQAKSAKLPADDGFYDFLLLFEHENIEVVKATLKFLLAFQLACPDDFILHVNLDTLYKCGMKVAPELLNSDF